MPIISAIIVAGGASTRMRGVDKLWLDAGGKPVVERSIMAFDCHPGIAEIVVVGNADTIERLTALCAGYNKVSAVVPGGATRNASVQNGVGACRQDTQYYAIHDAARPFVSHKLISDVIAAAVEYGAAAPGLPVTDTIKEVDAHSTTVRTPDRSKLVAVATPQVFEAVLYRAAAKGQAEAYDDCQLLEHVGRKVKIVPGDAANIKITTPADVSALGKAKEADMRIGHGYDVHRLVTGRKLVLGGVVIPHETGLLGHSDADVLTHAVMDAIAGAAALGDIGKLFPDSDDAYLNADSVQLLHTILGMIKEKGWRIGNVDATVVCQAPKLRDFIDAMRARIAEALDTGIEQINIKATTEEGLGFTGHMQGIAAHAVVCLKK